MLKQEDQKTELVHTFKKNERDEIQISIVESNSGKFIDIRQYFLSPESGKFLPTKKGVRFPFSFLGDLQTAVNKLSALKG